MEIITFEKQQTLLSICSQNRLFQIHARTYTLKKSLLLVEQADKMFLKKHVPASTV